MIAKRSRKAALASPSSVAGVVERNIRTLLKRRREEEKLRSRHERAADAVTRFSGSMQFAYLHVILVGLWILINIGAIPFIPPFDPTFVVLAMVASVEAIFLATFVLITQNRMQSAADRRADLDLQISLLTEYELTRVLALLRALAKKHGVAEAHHEELRELIKDIAPEEVLDKIEQTEQRMNEEH